MIRHMRHGSPPRLMALQSILSPNRRESLPAPSAGVRIRPRRLRQRAAKGRNDRIFLEALHDFAVHNITWRALPEAFGNWNSIWKHYWRLSQAENEQELRILRRIRSWPHHRQIRPHGLTTRRLRTRIWIE